MDVAVYRPSTGHWFVRNQPTVQCGDPGDKPVPGDYNGDGLMDVAVFRPSTGYWFVRNQFAVSFGVDSSDIPVPGDYNGDGVDRPRDVPPVERAVVRPESARGVVRRSGRHPGAGRLQRRRQDGSRGVPAVDGTWFVRNQFSVQFGDSERRPGARRLQRRRRDRHRGLPAVDGDSGSCGTCSRCRSEIRPTCLSCGSAVRDDRPCLPSRPTPWADGVCPSIQQPSENYPALTGTFERAAYVTAVATRSTCGSGRVRPTCRSRASAEPFCIQKGCCLARKSLPIANLPVG